MMKYPDEIAEQILDFAEQAVPLKATVAAIDVRRLIRDAARSGYLRGLQDAAGVVRELHDDGRDVDEVLLAVADEVEGIATRSRFEDVGRRLQDAPGMWRRLIA